MWSDPKDLKSRDLFYGPEGRPASRADRSRSKRRIWMGPIPSSWCAMRLASNGRSNWVWRRGRKPWPRACVGRGLLRHRRLLSSRHENRQHAPAKLHRGQKLVEPGGLVHNVRLEAGTQGPKETRQLAVAPRCIHRIAELNGLRVLMAVINNWDLKDVNNAIYQVDRRGFIWSATWARALDRRAAPGLARAQRTMWLPISQLSIYPPVTTDSVDFATPARPSGCFRWIPGE